MTRSLLLLAAAATLTVSAFAQAPSTPPPAGAPPTDGQQHRPHRPMPMPTNLKVLPKDWTGDEVMEVMHKFEADLGVDCGFCHDAAKDPATGRRNFASDANPRKDKARVMIKMNMAINHEYLTQLSPAPETRVGCGTCHRGNAKPPAFVPPPDEHDHHDGPPPPAAPK
jgi:hypothetical protein